MHLPATRWMVRTVLLIVLAIIPLARASAAEIVFTGADGPSWVPLPLQPGNHKLTLACVFAAAPGVRNARVALIASPGRGQSARVRLPRAGTAIKGVRFRSLRVRGSVVLALPPQASQCAMITTGSVFLLPLPSPTPTPTPDLPPNDPPSDPPSDPTPPSDELLSVADFHYLGTARLPQAAVGRSTGFATGLLAARNVGGTLHFFSDTHIYSNGELYEFTVPHFATSGTRPDALLVKEWGSIYGDKRVKADLTPYGNGVPVNGIFWDEARQGLWWAYAEPYNTLNRGAPTIGFTKFHSDGTIQPFDALKLHENTHWVRGGVLKVPPAYVPLLGGRELAAGFGGYYSIIGGGSWGPALTVFDPANPQSRQTVLGYPVDTDTRVVRPGDYWIASPGWLGVTPATGQPGSWTGADEIGGETSAGSAVFLNLPAGRGLLIWASHGVGRIGYDAGAITAEQRRNRLYIYDPEDLVAVHRNEMPMSLTPKAVTDWPTVPGFSGRVAGVAVDPNDPATLYIVETYAYHAGVEFYPVIHKYRVGS